MEHPRQVRRELDHRGQNGFDEWQTSLMRRLLAGGQVQIQEQAGLPGYE